MSPKGEIARQISSPKTLNASSTIRRVPIAYVVGTTFSRGVGVAIGTQLSNKLQHLFDYSALCRRLMLIQINIAPLACSG